MSEQLSLLGMDAPLKKPTNRLFFALFPDADTAARIAELALQLRGEHGLHGMPLKTERFHVTLHHLGDYPDLTKDIVATASQAAAAIAMAPFEAAFDRAASFSSTPRNRPFVLRGGDGVTALMEFQQALGMAIKKTALGRWVKSGYTPHVTLLYDDRSIVEQAVEPITWTAHEFVLVHSLLGQNRHVPLGRWPLRR